MNYEKNRKNKNKRKNRHIKKNLADYILLKIPFNRDFFKDLKDLHKKKVIVLFKLLLMNIIEQGLLLKVYIKFAN